MKIKAVTFDAAGTLFFPKPSVGSIYQEILASQGLALESSALETAFHSAFKHTTKDVGIADPEDRERAFWRAVVSRSIQSLTSLPSNFDATFELLWQAFAEGSRWKLNRDANELFRFLDERGIPFALLTNWDRRVRSVLRDHQLETRFASVFVSSEIGFEKPDPRVFQYAAESLGVPPERILHVGDHAKQDVGGAREAGWQAAHFLPNGTSTREGGATIRRLRDLCPFVEPH